MKQVRITVMRMANYRDLIEKYENPIPHPCDMKEGQIFVVQGDQKPEGLCDSAWETLRPFALALARGEGDFYGGWLKHPMSALLSCNDGFRPVSFLLEGTDIDAD